MGAEVGVGVAPAGFQPVEETLFDFGGDVGVGLDDAVVEVVSEPSGLGDLGNAVGDQPGRVTVPQSVHGQSRQEGVEPGGGVGECQVAVGGWEQRSSGRPLIIKNGSSGVRFTAEGTA